MGHAATVGDAVSKIEAGGDDGSASPSLPSLQPWLSRCMRPGPRSRFDAIYVADKATIAGAGTDLRSASLVIAQALRGRRDGTSAYYVNPLGGNRAIVCQTALPSAAGDTPP
jgi:hypothetical protein